MTDLNNRETGEVITVLPPRECVEAARTGILRGKLSTGKLSLGLVNEVPRHKP
jgi:hypothetical protein